MMVYHVRQVSLDSDQLYSLGGLEELRPSNLASEV